MKKFLCSMIITVCGFLAIFMVFAIGILAYRNMKLLVDGILNVSLLLEFVGAVFIFGFLISIFKVVEDKNCEHTLTIDEAKQLEHKPDTHCTNFDDHSD